jgi:methionyl-tRNA formyltransferase
MKTRKDLSIVFMGTPDFAVGILDSIYKSNFTIKGVVTSPDKPSGRGLQLNESAVKKYASEHNLNILQPEKLKDEAFLKELQFLNADLFVVVAFRMLPEQVWGMPKFGTINLHASLLPQYRGAAPINWALISGEKTSGVTTFFIEKAIDTGKIIEQATVDIDKDETDKMKLII